MPDLLCCVFSSSCVYFCVRTVWFAAVLFVCASVRLGGDFGIVQFGGIV